MPGVVAEWRSVVQDKYTGRGASSPRFVQKIGETPFFGGRCNTGGWCLLSLLWLLLEFLLWDDFVATLTDCRAVFVHFHKADPNIFERSTIEVYRIAYCVSVRLVTEGLSRGEGICRERLQV